jgi:hypothetical protein
LVPGWLIQVAGNGSLPERIIVVPRRVWIKVRINDNPAERKG